MKYIVKNKTRIIVNCSSLLEAEYWKLLLEFDGNEIRIEEVK